LSLEFSPGKSLVNTLAFQNQVSHQTQGNVMLLGTGLWAGGPLHRVAHLTDQRIPFLTSDPLPEYRIYGEPQAIGP
jgi:hypothetical protein